jgi:hypothetical protein
VAGIPDKRLEDRGDGRTKRNIKIGLKEMDWVGMTQTTGPYQNFFRRGQGTEKIIFRSYFKTVQVFSESPWNYGFTH